MPKKQKSTAGTVESAGASDTKSCRLCGVNIRQISVGTPTCSNSVCGYDEKRLRKQKNSSKTRMPRRSFTPSLRKETEEIAWFQRPAGPQCCSNFKDCGRAEAMFWCHPCGLAFCLECRTCGLACDHSIINYSSELSSDFLPDSISSNKSPFDIGVLIDAVLAESSYFGATRLGTCTRPGRKIFKTLSST